MMWLHWLRGNLADNRKSLGARLEALFDLGGVERPVEDRHLVIDAEPVQLLRAQVETSTRQRRKHLTAHFYHRNEW
jgi:hypothetical protein